MTSNSAVGQDLAIGAAAEDVGAIVDAGVVHVIYGSAAGLTATGSQYWNQNSAGIADAVETGDRFGSALAAGKLNNDAFAELVVGVADERRRRDARTPASCRSSPAPPAA